jgi:hypothetical protein
MIRRDLVNDDDISAALAPYRQVRASEQLRAAVSQAPGRSPQPSTVVARWRRPGRRTVLAGAIAIAAVAVLIAALVTTGSDSRSDDDLEARIIAAARTAATDMVVHEMDHWPENSTPVDAETWRDETTLSVRMVTYGPDGSPASDWGQVELPAPPPGERPPGRRLMRTIDYCNREYTDEEETSYPEDAVEVSVLAPIISGLDHGSYRVDGTEQVDGREMIRVVEGSTSAITYLVDPDTHLPVMMRAEVGEGNDRAFTQTYEYLPRTPENLAQLQAADPPEGFQQVDELSYEYESCS